MPPSRAALANGALFSVRIRHFQTTEPIMLSRREFLATSSLAAAGTACTSGRAATTEENLADSIANLESMSELATPISADERRGRIEKARRLMRENSLTGMMLTGGTSLEYFTGVRWGLSERLFAVILPVSAQPFVVTPAFEEERTREQLASGPLDSTEVLAWEEHESPFRLVAGGLRARGLSAVLRDDHVVFETHAKFPR